MFNKPNLFPKTNEPQAVRGRALSSGQAGGSPSLQGESLGNVRETSPAATGPFSSSVGSVTTSHKVDANKGENETVSESRLIVGPDVKLKGAEILDCDTLVVEGRVEATMDSRVLRIAEQGSFAGTVGIDVAEIHGVFDGELTARSQLIIHATGKVSGKIRYGKIFIEEGGQISGDIRAIEAAAPIPLKSVSSSTAGNDAGTARTAETTE